MPTSYLTSRNIRKQRIPAIQPGEKLLSVVPDVAERLHVSRSMAWALVRTGELGSVRIGDRRLVPSSWVDAYLEDRAADSVA
jgi:excisionase family DNA binding protein